MVTSLCPPHSHYITESVTFPKSLDFVLQRSAGTSESRVRPAQHWEADCDCPDPPYTLHLTLVSSLPTTQITSHNWEQAGVNICILSKIKARVRGRACSWYWSRDSQVSRLWCLIIECKSTANTCELYHCQVIGRSFSKNRRERQYTFPALPQHVGSYKPSQLPAASILSIRILEEREKEHLSLFYLSQRLN